jgi:hypothetical protein
LLCTRVIFSPTPDHLHAYTREWKPDTCFPPSLARAEPIFPLRQSRFGNLSLEKRACVRMFYIAAAFEEQKRLRRAERRLELFESSSNFALRELFRLLSHSMGVSEGV